MRFKKLTLTIIGLSGLAALAAWAAPQPPAPAAQPKADAPTPDEAAIRKLTAAFVAAANARDAKAAAALWTEQCEFTDADGTVTRGRAAMETLHADDFRTTPKGRYEIVVEGVRVLGKHLATSEGTIRFVPADGTEPGVTKYAALHSREGDTWLTASVREWVPEEAELVSLADLAWLIGEWEAKQGDRRVSTVYSWGDEKGYIECRFRVTEKDKVVASGLETIAKDPSSGEIRAWLFDRSGTLAETVWSRDGKRWVVEVTGTLPDGSDLTATNALVPIGPDAFTWVSVDRTAAGESLPNVRPLKVTRVKK